ncbi:carbohydrate sulfotransferase 1 [Acipenser oxyrinchus oxyrinchus]|uniref:Sulfotransferase n=1 Tax=Acipenser oxyrinchus oxyrinchus TaxID=40147 RepID=A0AAD8DFS1_ACIOX|nr:carbohydrate sulfotransferase 1 [Acipenser oxyrinchus oxyrinchus]
MECSWKTVVLLVCASLGIQYTVIRSLRDTFSSPCQGGDHCQHREPKEYRWRSPCYEGHQLPGPFHSHARKHIILFATTRSGSSFTGQLFNQHPDIFYLFEPLYHVQQAFTNSSARLRKILDRRALLGACRDLLHNLYNCDFHFLENYIKPEPRDHATGSFFRRGSSSALCSPPVCEDSPDAQEPDEIWCSKKCRSLNLTLAGRACQDRGHMAIKTVRIPEIKDLKILSEDPRLNLKIVHLVRDPRGILASRMTAFMDQFRAWKIWNATGRKPHYVDLSQITRTCKDLSDSAETGFSKPTWLKGRYMLVRYEDLAKEPVEKAKEIYKFIGLDMDDKIHTWILHNTNASNAPEGNYKFTTTRNSKATAESWRLNLSFDIVQTVQNLCNTTLSQLGYRNVNSVADLRNMSNSVVEPRTFLPFL